jgi:hypothetical protein
MSALQKETRISNDIKLVYNLSEKPNLTQLRSHIDRAVVAKLRADLILPNNKVMTVDIDFDTDSGFHDNTMMVMDDFGVDILVAGFTAKYGPQHGDKIRQAWNQKQQPEDPRKPTYLLVQKPKDFDSLPQVFAACGTIDHNSIKVPDSLV